MTGVAAKDTLYGYWSLTPENTGVSPLSKMQKKYKLPSDLCVKCKLTIEDTCVHLGMYQRWHPHCLQCQLCNKAASVGSGSTQTSSHAQVDAVTDLSVTLAHKVGPGLQDLQKRGRRILAERNAEKAEENTWIGRMVAAENINDMKALIKSRDSA